MIDRRRLFAPVRSRTITPAVHFHLTHVVPDPCMHGLYGYREIIETVAWGLQALGHRVSGSVNGGTAGATHVVFGFHMLDEPGLRMLPPDTIVYNLEQMANVPPDQMKPAFRYAAQHFRVWEYSRHNLAAWQSLNPAREPRLVPIGYAPVLSRILKRDEQEIDALFYGLPGDARLAAFRDLCNAGLRVVFACGLYGPSRDDLIARSKVVLNLNKYARSRIFEVARVSYLLANAKAVVSDLHPDSYVEPDLREAVAFAPPEQIVPTCVRLVQDAAARRALEQRGLDAMRRRDIRQILSDALAGEGAEDD